MKTNEMGQYVCEECGETHDLHITSRCHPYATPTIILSSHTKVVKVECSVCEMPVCYFLVRSGPHGEIPQ